VPTEVDFPFEATEEGWTFANPAGFATVMGDYDDANQSLDVMVMENTDSFAYYLSPTFTINSPRRGSSTVINGLLGSGSLYRATFTVKSSVDSAALSPTIRLRSNSGNLEQSDVTVITSQGEGSLSPDSATAKSYRHYFSQPASSSSFTLAFDVLNFDPSDAAAATLFVQDVTVEALAAPAAGGTEVTSLDFVANGASGFTFQNALPTIAEPAVNAIDDGLHIAGIAPARVVIPQGTLFGYWTGESTATLTGGQLYAATFLVASNATAENKGSIPTFRLRVNDSSMKFSAYVNIDARDTSSRVPVTGAPESYTLWFEAPAAIDANTLHFSFDYLYVGGSGEDAYTRLVLQSITMSSYPAP
jgi:hypothetical protein